MESIRKNRPDLIILDVMMPEMNGFDVAAILKNDPQTMDIPIIVLSIVQDKARGYQDRCGQVSDQTDRYGAII